MLVADNAHEHYTLLETTRERASGQRHEGFCMRPQSFLSTYRLPTSERLNADVG